MEALINRVPDINRFFCWKLRTGCLIVGYFSVILGFLSTIASVLLLIEIIDLQDKQKVPDQELDRLAIVLLIYSITCCISATIIDMFLIIGVHKNNRRLIYLWIWCSVIFTCFLVGFIIVGLIYLPSNHISSLIGLVISLYTTVAVMNYYKKMDDSPYVTA